MRTRFAPSPTGYLHLGHVMAARAAHDFAERNGGVCHLRIENTDHTRCKAEYNAAILDNLTWLGFQYPQPVRTQSAHYPDYAGVVAELLQRGLAYPCELTRAQIKAGTKPSYDAASRLGKNWQDMSIQSVTAAAKTAKPALPFAIRLDLEKSLNSVSAAALIFEETGPQYTGQHNAAAALSGKVDLVIARKDIGCSYMVAGPHDDAIQSMTHIVRGADLFSETPLQILLQALMDWPRPIYHHHALIMGSDGKKLSKRSFAESIASLRDNGIAAEDILAKAAI